MEALSIIEDPATAEAALDPIRSSLLAALREPASATMLANRLGLPRQKVNYHLKTLEGFGLVSLVEERRKGNVTERLLQANAASFVISPVALLELAPDPTEGRDRLSARWLVALAARLIRDVGTLITGAAAAKQKLSTFALDGEVRFKNAADRAAFIEDLSSQIGQLVQKYHEPAAASGRKHRIVLAIHPSVKKEAENSAALVRRTQTIRTEQGEHS